MSDLRNLVAAQESYFEDHAAYAPDVATLKFRGGAGTQITIVEAKTDGWSAEAKRPGVSGSCAFHVGTAAPILAGSPHNQVWSVE